MGFSSPTTAGRLLSRMRMSKPDPSHHPRTRPGPRSHVVNPTFPLHTHNQRMLPATSLTYRTTVNTRTSQPSSIKVFRLRPKARVRQRQQAWSSPRSSLRCRRLPPTKPRPGRIYLATYSITWIITKNTSPIITTSSSIKGTTSYAPYCLNKHCNMTHFYMP